MKRFDSISIFNYPPIESVHLNELGRINVLCGKNSSGKSTVLNALNELSKGKIPQNPNTPFAPTDSFAIKTNRTRLTIDDFNLGEIVKIDSAYYDEEPNSDNTIFSREFISGKLLEYMEEENSEENSFEREEFIKSFSEFLAKTRLYKSIIPGIEAEFAANLPTELIQQLISQILPSRKSIKLIPTTRQLLSKCQSRDYHNCSTEGEFIINYIHYCKNQLVETVEYLNFLKLQKAFIEISEGLKFEIIIKDNLELEVLFSNREGRWINADNSGLGLRDLLIILFQIILINRDIILIEEPERHLHSSTQRRLLRYLSNQNKQFFIATHSNVFLDLDYVDSIFITEYINGQINVTNESSKARALMELGYSVADNIVSDLVILTEGPSDKAIIEHFLFELGALKSKIVKFWPLGGDIMDKHDLSVLKDSYHVIALVDNDPGSSVIRTRFNAKCTELGIKCHRLQRYSIENYITLEALKRQFSTQIPSSLTSIDPDIKLEDQIGLNVKNTLNRVVKHMTFSDIKDTDLGEFILEVNRLLEQNPSALKA